MFLIKNTGIERLVDAVALMDRLRTAGPWESQQTHDSLRRYLLEETYELFDAVHGGDLGELRDELGDVLLQVLFHARIAEEAGFKGIWASGLAMSAALGVRDQPWSWSPQLSRSPDSVGQMLPA